MLIPQEKEELLQKLDRIAIGMAVLHKKFGVGTIERINKNEKFIFVKFNGGEKNFIFPDAFSMGFLELE